MIILLVGYLVCAVVGTFLAARECRRENEADQRRWLVPRHRRWEIVVWGLIGPVTIIIFIAIMAVEGWHKVVCFLSKEA